MSVKVNYKTDAGSEWDSRDKAMIADELEQIDCYYAMRGFVLVEVVNAIADKFFVIHRSEIVEVQHMVDNDTESSSTETKGTV